jgi:hypothetical protein
MGYYSYMHVTVITREGTIIMEEFWYIRTGLYKTSNGENMSQPGMEQRSGVYTYKEWSGRTCLNQEWSGRTCLNQEWNGGVEWENMSQPGMERRSGVYKGNLCFT